MIYRFIDIETYCDLDLKKVGRKNYTEHNSFEINLVGWVDVEVPTLADLKDIDLVHTNFKQLCALYNTNMKTAITNYLKEGFQDSNIIHVAHNAAFEIAAFEKILNIKMDLTRWICTMVWSYQTGLPGGLPLISKVLKLTNGKLPGVNLIKYFAKPCKPTKVNGGRIRNYPKDNIEKWEEYKYYNKFDVLSVIELCQKVLISFPQPAFEHDLWVLDQKIQNSGIHLDSELIFNSLIYIDQFTKEIQERLKSETGLDNPNSNQQFKGWLQNELPDVYIESIDKDHLKHYYDLTNDKRVKDVIQLKQGGSKTSLKKYNKLADTMYLNRIYDLLQFTATGTGRWAGRNFQVHNLPKNKLGKDLETIRNAYRNMSRPITEKLPFELSQLLRTVLVPDEGKVFMVADYSAIEARVAAWIANEEWVIKAFKDGRDIYIETASRMFDKAYEEINSADRQDGKVAVLACGYGGGQNAIANFAPDWSEEKRQLIVDYYRQANKNIVKMWRTLEKAVSCTLKDKKTTKIGNLIISMKKGCLLIKLPSGRSLTYVRARKDESITYEEVSNQSWSRTKTYGGKLFENVVQAIARDILAYALWSLDQKGYNIKFHVHDEVIVQIDKELIKDNTLQKFCEHMTELPDWAEGLPMKAEGFITNYYKKEE